MDEERTADELVSDVSGQANGLDRLEDVDADLDEQLAFLAQDVRRRASRYLFLARALSDEEVTFGLIDGLRDIPPRTHTELDAFAASLRGDSDPQTDANVSNACRAVRADHQAVFASDVVGEGHGELSLLESRSVRFAVAQDGGADVDEVDEVDGETGEVRSPYVDAQDVVDSIEEAYATYDFDRKKSRYIPEANMPVDHVCAELSFMAYLGGRASDALDSIVSGRVREDSDEGFSALDEAQTCMNDQFNFIADHSVYWVPAFCDRLERRAATSFYRGVAQLLRQVIESDQDYLDAMDPTGAR